MGGLGRSRYVPGTGELNPMLAFRACVHLGVVDLIELLLGR